MGSFSDVFEVDVLKALTGQATTILTTTPLATVFVRLTTTTPTESAAGTEVTTGVGYAPVDSKGKWGTPAAGSVANNLAVAFATATGAWGTVVGFELWTATTGGNRLAWGTLGTTKTPTTGDTPTFAIGALVATLD